MSEEHNVAIARRFALTKMKGKECWKLVYVSMSGESAYVDCYVANVTQVEERPDGIAINNSYRVRILSTLCSQEVSTTISWRDLVLVSDTSLIVVYQHNQVGVAFHLGKTAPRSETALAIGELTGRVWFGLECACKEADNEDS